MDGFDLRILAADYGSTGCPCSGDINSDGQVNAADLGLFCEEYGTAGN